MLKIKERNGQIIEIINGFEFSSWRYGEVNNIVLEGFKDYGNKIIEFYFEGFSDAGIIRNVNYDSKLNKTSLDIYPLIDDLKSGFLEDSNGNKIVYFDDSAENILEYVINQYRNKINNPLLNLEKITTGINIKQTFNYKTWFDVYKFLEDILRGNGYGFIVDMGIIQIVEIGKNGKILAYPTDIPVVNLKKNYDEIINYIIFDNGRVGDGKVLKEYKDQASIDKYGKRVKYIKKTDIKDETTADKYCEGILNEYKEPKISIEQVEVKENLELFTKLKILNYNVSTLIVTGKEILNNGKIYLDVDLYEKRKFLDEGVNDWEAPISEVKDEITNDPALKNPDYIEETYIDSTEIKSPTISGNNGYFSGIFKVGTDGIIIDGQNKEIRSSNYNRDNKTGFYFKDNGSFLLGKDTNNYFGYDGTNFEFKGKLIAGAGSSIEWNYIQNAPVSDWLNPSYIKSTYIDSTEIKAPTISGNDGLFSGTFKVGSDGIVIDGVNKLIKSSNFSSGSAGWQIKNDGTAEFNNVTVRGTVDSSNIQSSSISGTTITGGVLQTATSGKRVRIGQDNNRIQIFDSNGNEIANFGYNTNSYNNILYAKVGADGYNGPLLFLESSRDTNTARFIGHTNGTYPVVSIEAGSTSDKGLYVKGASYFDGNLFGNNEIRANTNLVSNGGIQTYGGTVAFYNTIKFYFRYNNTCLEVGDDGKLYWRAGDDKYEINMTAV